MANPIFEKQVLQELKNLTQAYVNLATYVQSMGENLALLAQALQEENEELPTETNLETVLEEGLVSHEEGLG
jgi:hypothetical protein